MRGYLLAHWQGRQSLLRSVLLNGALLYLVLVVVLVVVGQAADNNSLFTLVGAMIFLLWVIWAAVGIFRCGARNALDRANSIGSRIGGAIAIICMVAVICLSMNDARHLFRLF
jgi:hypothetical protein